MEPGRRLPGLVRHEPIRNRRLRHGVREQEGGRGARGAPREERPVGDPDRPHGTGPVHRPGEALAACRLVPHRHRAIRIDRMDRRPERGQAEPGQLVVRPEDRHRHRPVQDGLLHPQGVGRVRRCRQLVGQPEADPQEGQDRHLGDQRLDGDHQVRAGRLRHRRLRRLQQPAGGRHPAHQVHQQRVSSAGDSPEGSLLLGELQHGGRLFSAREGSVPAERR